MGPNATLNALKKIKVSPYARNVTPISQLSILCPPYHTDCAHVPINSSEDFWYEIGVRERKPTFFFIHSQYCVGKFTNIGLHSEQHYTKPEWLNARAAKLYTVTPNILGASV